MTDQFMIVILRHLFPDLIEELVKDYPNVLEKNIEDQIRKATQELLDRS